MLTKLQEGFHHFNPKKSEVPPAIIAVGSKKVTEIYNKLIFDQIKKP
jgi:hypothetical protein